MAKKEDYWKWVFRRKGFWITEVILIIFLFLGGMFLQGIGASTSGMVISYLCHFLFLSIVVLFLFFIDWMRL